MFSEDSQHPARPVRPGARRHLRRSATALVLLATALGVALGTLACGKKGEPLPPVRQIPREAGDLAVGQRGPELFFTVGYPQVTVGGLALPGLGTVQVLRLIVPAPSSGEVTPVDPRQFAGAAEVVETLQGKDLTDATEGDRLRWRRRLAPEELTGARTYVYAVRFITPAGESSAASNQAAVIPAEPPPAPGELAADARADGIEIRWADGEEGVGGYRVYRRLAAEKTYGDPLTSLGLDARSFLDTGARYDHRYIYAVTSVSAARPTLESALGAEREIDYRDRFPPPAPEGLVALAEGGQVRLTWEAGPVPETTGYHVYRRQATEQTFTRLTVEPVVETRYLVEDLAAGSTYVFRVTALDAAGNEGAPSREATATAR